MHTQYYVYRYLLFVIVSLRPSRTLIWCTGKSKGWMVVLKYVGVSRLVILKFYFSHLSISFCFIYGLLFKSGRYYKGTYKTILSSLWFEVNYLVIYYLKILNPK